VEKRQVTCINCPLGCTLDVEIHSDDSISVTGFQCARGEDYAKKEVLNPTRTITSTVPVLNGDVPMVSVKTSGDIPKKSIKSCMLALKDVVVEAPIYIGDIIVEHICGTDINIVATKEVKKK